LVNHEVTDFRNVDLRVVRGKDFETILVRNPVSIPYIDGITIANFPTTSFIYGFNSMVYALPSITAGSALLGL
jgi:hypothetical protein